MAAWHFSFCVVPKAGILNVYGRLPSNLQEYGPRNTDDESEFESNNYWKQFPELHHTVGDRLLALLPPQISWTDEAKMAGEKEKHQISVWPEEIIIQLDLRHFSKELYDNILSIVRAHDCMIVVVGSGNLISAADDFVGPEIRGSLAYKFCFDPEKFAQFFDEREGRPKS